MKRNARASPLGRRPSAAPVTPVSATNAQSAMMSTMSLEEYRTLAEDLGLDGFVKRFERPFLLKRPSPEDAGDAESIGYATQAIDSAHLDQMSLDQDFAASWWIAPIEKRPGNPYPDRISIGRAQNCDIVLRLPFISKLHAHFSPSSEGTVAITDNRSANGTLVNGKALDPGAKSVLSFGDVVRLGPLELELVNAKTVYRLVTTTI